MFENKFPSFQGMILSNIASFCSTDAFNSNIFFYHRKQPCFLKIFIFKVVGMRDIIIFRLFQSIIY